MIPAAEVHRRAREWQVDPMVVELDYVLGCFLAGWFRHPQARGMILKGGTCLRKCYFPDYRFSEDIDITSGRPIDGEKLRQAIDTVASDIRDNVGVDLQAHPTRMEIVDDGRGSLYLEACVYFRGPLQRTGWPQARAGKSHRRLLKEAASHQRSAFSFCYKLIAGSGWLIAFAARVRVNGKGGEYCSASSTLYSRQ